MFAYNIKIVFKVFVHHEKILTTLRYKGIDVGVYFEKVKDTIKLEI